ncbi:MAG: hypothetical protein ACT4PM_02605 [Gemmatimonadales bacterium]
MKPVVSLLLSLTLAATACSGGGGYEGRWESTFGGVVLDLKSDGTVAISVAGIPSEGTWDRLGKDQIVVRGPRQDMTLTKSRNGDLTDGLGGRFVRPKG